MFARFSAVTLQFIVRLAVTVLNRIVDFWLGDASTDSSRQTKRGE